MLSTVLTNIQTWLGLGRVMVFGLPAITFIVANVAMMYVYCPFMRDAIQHNLVGHEPAIDKTWWMAALSLLAVILTYAASALVDFLRGVMEGRHWWDWLRDWFLPPEESHFERYRARRAEALESRHDLTAANRAAWETKLADALAEGGEPQRRQHRASLEELDALVLKTAELRSEATQQLLRRQRIESQVVQLEKELKAGGNPAEHEMLAKAHTNFLAALNEGASYADSEDTRRANELNSMFGETDRMPTRMGNIVNAVQHQALRRYHCNLERIWSRILPVIEKDKLASERLQAAKAHLDFMVICFWFTLGWTVTWVLALTYCASAWIPYVLVCGAGPGMCLVWYHAAAEQYRAFGAVVLSLLDQFRFDLIKDMRMLLPTDVVGERWYWDRFNDWATYGQEENFRFEHPKTGGGGQ